MKTSAFCKHNKWSKIGKTSKNGEMDKKYENDKWCVIWRIYEKLFSWAFFNKINVEKASKLMDQDFERYIQDCQGALRK